MKRNKTKKIAAIGMLAVMTLAAGALAACGGQEETKEKQDLGVTVTGAQNGVVNATYSGQPIAVSVTSEQSVTYVVKYAGADGTVYEESETAPTNAGKYTVSITYAGDENYNPYSGQFTLSIGKAENAFTVTIADYTFGGAASVPVVTGNKGGDVTFVYEGTGQTEYASSATAPTAAGTYQLTATAAANANYLEGKATDTFEVVLSPRTDVPTQAPVLDTNVKVLNDSFKIVTQADTEYRVVDGEGNAATEWQSEGDFTGLKQNTTYYVEARRPATSENAPSAAGENKLEVKTMKGGLLDNFDRQTSVAGNFELSEEQAHSGTKSIKTYQPDGTYGYILQPNLLVEREDNDHNPYNGHWQNGSFENNWIDLTGYRYLSFWIYFAKDAESVTFGTGTIEIWNGNDMFNCWLGQKTYTTGEWHRVVVDLTQVGVLNGDFDAILEQITKIYINFHPIAAADIGTFYLDDIEVLADLEKEEGSLTVTGEESGVLNAVYSGSPVAITATKPLGGGGTLNITYTGIEGTEYAESKTAPTNVGKYKVTVSLTGNTFYNVPDKEVTLVIAKAENAFTVTMANFNFGEDPSSPVITGNKGGTPAVTYVGTGDTVYEESATVPTAVGTYKVKVSVAESENYLAGSAEAEFMIVSAPRTDVPTQAPVLDATKLVLDDSFTLTAQDDTEYRVVNAAGEEVAPWQAGATFIGLQPDTTYTVQARRPAKDGHAPSAAGEQALQVKTAQRFILDDFEKKPAGDTSCGNFVVSSDKAHSGEKSLKTGTPDGAGYILQPISLLSDGNGYWQNGSYNDRYIDISGYRYLSFYIFVDSTQESVTLPGGDTFEVYNGNNGEPNAGAFTCWRTDKTIKCGSWQRVVIDLTVNTLYWGGTLESVSAHVTKLYFTQVVSIGTFYLDDLVLLKDPAAAESTQSTAQTQSAENVAIEDKFATEKKSVSKEVE